MIHFLNVISENLVVHQDNIGLYFLLDANCQLENTVINAIHSSKLKDQSRT